jgi:hypothetical protein
VNENNRIRIFSFVLYIWLTAVHQITFAAFPNPVVIITDMMDDDIRALNNVFLDPSKSTLVKAILVSTGNTSIKAAVASAMVSGFGLNIPVIEGTPVDLASNEITAFAASYLEEGIPLISRADSESIRNTFSNSQTGVQQLYQIFQQVERDQKQLDIMLLTAPTDLVKAIKVDVVLSKKILGDLFVMGLYKQQANGTLLAPYNTMADPESVFALLRMYQRDGIIQRLIHVPSDTIQLRSGLPGGYFPKDEMGKILSDRLRIGMGKVPILEAIFRAAQNYGENWVHFATRNYGLGFKPTDRNGWVFNSFQDPSEAGVFYIADSVCAAVSGMSNDSIDKLNIITRRVDNPPFGTDLMTQFTFLNSSDEKLRPIYDVNQFDGMALVNYHIDLIESAGEMNLPKLIVPRARAKFVANQSPKKNIESYERTGLSKKAIYMNFKNSPDDWFALVRLVSTDVGLTALVNGGIITEGFQSKNMRLNVIKFLGSIGIENIPVAAGYNYDHSEVAGIVNFKGELAFNEGVTDLAGKAFENLPMPKTGINALYTYRPSDILEHAIAWAKNNAASVDAILLGEGIDFINEVQNGSIPDVVDYIGNVYAMGGGRKDPSDDNREKLVLTRNWVRSPGIILRGLENLGNARKRVFIFSSNLFGGSINTLFDEKVASDKQMLLSSLVEASHSNPGMKSLIDHWANWARVFAWVMTPEEKRPKNSDGTPKAFDPNSTLQRLSTSPLGFSIVDAWLEGGVENHNSKDIDDSKEVRLSKLLQGTSHETSSKTNVIWLQPRGGEVDLPHMAERFGFSVRAIETNLQATNYHKTVREKSIFSAEAAVARSELSKISAGITEVMRCEDIEINNL